MGAAGAPQGGNFWRHRYIFLVCRDAGNFWREIQDFGREIWAPQAPLREGISGAGKREIRAPQAPQEEDLGAEGTGGDLRAPQDLDGFCY